MNQVDRESMEWTKKSESNGIKSLRKETVQTVFIFIEFPSVQLIDFDWQQK